MDINHLNNVYFIGIGGIGMSALAKWFRRQGVTVQGYDKTRSNVTDELENLNIPIYYDDGVDAIGGLLKKVTTADTLIVYTPAIPDGHPQLAYFREQGFTVMKRAEVLAEVTRPYYTIAVAGTHGKTTTASMIAHLLNENGIDFYAFLGGISTNFESNFVSPDEGKEAELCVVEADEYDRSFLHLEPNVLIINSLDPDHMDVYEEYDQLIEAYKKLCGQLRQGGRIFCKKGLEFELKFSGMTSFGLEEKADIHPLNVVEEPSQTSFSLVMEEDKNDGFLLHQQGKHNLLNAMAALGCASLWVEKEQLKSALASFRGLKRRFEKRYDDGRQVLIDDYAHHPREIAMVIDSCRAIFPDRKITGVFQPHLYSRTRDFMDDFAHELSRLDEAILIPIYPAREEPIEGVTSKALCDSIPNEKKWHLEREEVEPFFREHDTEVLLILGAGDIDRLVQPIEETLRNKKTPQKDA